MNKTLPVVVVVGLVGVGAGYLLRGSQPQRGPASVEQAKAQLIQASMTPAAGEKVAHTFPDQEAMQAFVNLWQQRQERLVRMAMLEGYWNNDQATLNQLNSQFNTQYQLDLAKRHVLDAEKRVLVERVELRDVHLVVVGELLVEVGDEGALGVPVGLEHRHAHEDALALLPQLREGLHGRFIREGVDDLPFVRRWRCGLRGAGVRRWSRRLARGLRQLRLGCRHLVLDEHAFLGVQHVALRQVELVLGVELAVELVQRG
ncbi:MAG: hypothetical protein HYZ96_00955, partial [Candidatus Omnitrophica bacterium]|nr:hypothetical protein [Candidatus Omnitrophota bacterium]